MSVQQDESVHVKKCFILFGWNALAVSWGGGLPLTLLLIDLTPAGHHRQILSNVFCLRKTALGLCSETNHVHSPEQLEKY